MTQQSMRVDIGQLLIIVPQVQAFIADLRNSTHSGEEKIALTSTFVKKMLISTETILGQDLADNVKFNDVVDSLVVLVLAALDAIEKIQELGKPSLG